MGKFKIVIYVIIIIIIIFLFNLAMHLPKYLLKTEGYSLDAAKDEVRAAYAIDNPNIQYTVDPVPDMIRTINGESYYPVLPARRPNAIVNPITEPYLRNVMINNINNIGMNTAFKDGEMVMNNHPYQGGNNTKLQAYAYPHSDLPTSQTYITGEPLYAVNQHKI